MKTDCWNRYEVYLWETELIRVSALFCFHCGMDYCDVRWRESYLLCNGIMQMEEFIFVFTDLFRCKRSDCDMKCDSYTQLTSFHDYLALWYPYIKKLVKTCYSLHLRTASVNRVAESSQRALFTSRGIVDRMYNWTVPLNSDKGVCNERNNGAEIVTILDGVRFVMLA